MNTSPETEHLQNALAGLATVMTKIISERIEQAVSEKLPVKLPANVDDKATDNRVVTKKQLAELLKVKPRTVDNWMKRGFLPYLKIGRSVRFKTCDVVRQLDDTALVDRARLARRGRWL
jgi:excisionase family DNA binding protein